MLISVRIFVETYLSYFKITIFRRHLFYELRHHRRRKGAIVTNGWHLEGYTLDYFKESYPDLVIGETTVSAKTLLILFEDILCQIAGKILGVSMDIEGAEYEVLHAHDWVIKPYFFYIEGHRTVHTSKCIMKLLENDYVLADYNGNGYGRIKAIREDILNYRASGKLEGDNWHS